MVRIRRLMAVCMCICMFCCSMWNMTLDGQAATKTYKGTKAGDAYKTGNYLYYAVNRDGLRTGIMRLNIKNGQKKRVVTNKNAKKQATNGFSMITVKGKYIYAVWDVTNGTDHSLTYIYRISVDGKYKKRLACGTDPVIVGKRIYYSKCKIKKASDGDRYTVITSQSSMKLNGSDKKSEKNTVFDWQTCHSTYSQKSSVISGKYSYSIQEENNAVIRTNRSTEKTDVIFTCDGTVAYIEVHSGNVLLEMYDDNYTVGKLYYLNSNGSVKYKLATWTPAQ